MKPWFKKNDELMFYKYLKKTEIYFEYGIGGSTYQAAINKNIKYIYSVESDENWFNKLKKILKNNEKVNFIFNEMETLPNTLGKPGVNCPIFKKISYSNQFTLLNKEIIKKINFILIDGRFRIACCLKLFDLINNDCYIAFDDFFRRPIYNIVLDYYDIIEETIDKSMVILKKKETIEKVPLDIIKKYELEEK